MKNRDRRINRRVSGFGTGDQTGPVQNEEFENGSPENGSQLVRPHGAIVDNFASKVKATATGKMATGVNSYRKK